ncbi:hypothetical protein LPJ59_007060 [Coemansia sp. RSA 2399]|nr:hypothetical protein LPJ59_007060 [Coemansia sp. RSA 2399]KAJ1884614.1 hypothetical protein LPJ81_007056 [Coemansia sp. IMI 209127]
MRRFSAYLVIAAVLGMAAVGKANDYASSNGDYDSGSNNDYGSGSNNDYGSGSNNDYSAQNNDYSAGNDYQSAPYGEDTTTVVIEGSSPCEPVVTPMYQTVVEDVVNTVIQYSTVLVEETQVQSIIEQVTSVQIASVSAEQTALYQVTQTYVCPPPPTVTVNNVNNVWITETATPTLQVVQTRVQPQVVVQQVTMTQQVQQVDVQTQVIQQQATAVVATNVHNIVQVVQENVGQDQLTTVVVVPDSGAAGGYESQPEAAPYATKPYATQPYATQPYATKPYATQAYATKPYASSQGYASSAAYGSS